MILFVLSLVYGACFAAAVRSLTTVPSLAGVILFVCPMQAVWWLSHRWVRRSAQTDQGMAGPIWCIGATLGAVLGYFLTRGTWPTALTY